MIRVALLCLTVCMAAAAVADPLPIPTVHFVVRDDDVQPIEPKKRKFKLRSGTRQHPLVHIVPPVVGGSGDPTLHGATLTIYNVGGPSQSATYDLPAARWRIIGTPENFKGWHFHDDTPADGPVARVFVKPDKLFVSGGKSGWTFVLGPVPQGALAVRIALGGDDGWCIETPAKTPPERYDTSNRFYGLKGSLPATCSPLP